MLVYFLDDFVTVLFCNALIYIVGSFLIPKLHPINQQPIQIEQGLNYMLFTLFWCPKPTSTSQNIATSVGNSKMHTLDKKSYSHIPTFYMALYSQFYGFDGPTFSCPIFGNSNTWSVYSV